MGQSRLSRAYGIVLVLVSFVASAQESTRNDRFELERMDLNPAPRVRSCWNRGIAASGGLPVLRCRALPAQPAGVRAGGPGAPHRWQPCDHAHGGGLCPVLWLELGLQVPVRRVADRGESGR